MPIIDLCSLSILRKTRSERCVTCIIEPQDLEIDPAHNGSALGCPCTLPSYNHLDHLARELDWLPDVFGFPSFNSSVLAPHMRGIQGPVLDMRSYMGLFEIGLGL